MRARCYIPPVSCGREPGPTALFPSPRYGGGVFTSASLTQHRLAVPMTFEVDEPAFALRIKPELLDHSEHLPETFECRCGFQRNVLTQQSVSREL